MIMHNFSYFIKCVNAHNVCNKHCPYSNPNAILAGDIKKKKKKKEEEEEVNFNP